MPAGLELMLIAAGALALAALSYRWVRRGGTWGALFVLAVGPQGEVSLQGSVPGKSDGDARDFVAQMELPPGAKIWARRDTDALRLQFTADVPDNLRQRARNYFGN